VVLSPLENEVGINFLLDKGGKISGTVIDSVTGLPIVNTRERRFQVEFYDATETVVGSAFINDDGTYISARSLPAGDYAARTGSMFVGQLNEPYVNEKYNEIDCAGVACDLSTADITVTTEVETTGINFTLSEGYTFSGTITDVVTSAPIPNVHVLVYKDMGAGEVKFANWATTSDGTVAGGPAIGTFEVTGLPEGTYFARTNNGSNMPFFTSGFRTVPPGSWIDILHSNIACPGMCDVTTGTPIILGPARGGATVIDFSLNPGATISGKVRDFMQGGPMEGITVNIFDDQGVFVSSTVSDSQGSYKSKGLNAGTYYLTTSSFYVIIDVLFGNEFCLLNSCDPLDAVPIQLNTLEEKFGQDFILKSRYLHMFEDGFE
jgi:hypothetical protein